MPKIGLETGVVPDFDDDFLLQFGVKGALLTACEVLPVLATRR